MFIRVCQHKSENYLTFVANERFAWLCQYFRCHDIRPNGEGDPYSPVPLSVLTFYRWLENAENYWLFAAVN